MPRAICVCAMKRVSWTICFLDLVGRGTRARVHCRIGAKDVEGERTCARNVLVPINPERPPAPATWLLPFGTFFRRPPWRRLRRNSARWLEKRAVDFVFVRARECTECFCYHQCKRATPVWNFFSPPPLAALAQEFHALARKSG